MEDERRSRGEESKEAVRRNHCWISRREVGVADLRSRVPTGTQSHLYTTPLTREKKTGLVGLWAGSLTFWEGWDTEGPGPLAVATAAPPTAVPLSEPWQTDPTGSTGARPGRRRHRRGRGPRRARREGGKHHRSTLRRGSGGTSLSRLRRCAAPVNRSRSGRWRATNPPKSRSTTARGKFTPPTSAGAGLERGYFLPRRRKVIAESYRRGANLDAQNPVGEHCCNLRLIFLVGALVRQSLEVGSARRPVLGQGGAQGERTREGHRRPSR
jgi:hypothetical protein